MGCQPSKTYNVVEGDKIVQIKKLNEVITGSVKLEQMTYEQPSQKITQDQTLFDQEPVIYNEKQIIMQFQYLGVMSFVTQFYFDMCDDKEFNYINQKIIESQANLQVINNHIMEASNQRQSVYNNYIQQIFQIIQQFGNLKEYQSLYKQYPAYKMYTCMQNTNQLKLIPLSYPHIQQFQVNEGYKNEAHMTEALIEGSKIQSKQLNKYVQFCMQFQKEKQYSNYLQLKNMNITEKERLQKFNQIIQNALVQNTQDSTQIIIVFLSYYQMNSNISQNEVNQIKNQLQQIEKFPIVIVVTTFDIDDDNQLSSSNYVNSTQQVQLLNQLESCNTIVVNIQNQRENDNLGCLVFSKLIEKLNKIDFSKSTLSQQFMSPIQQSSNKITEYDAVSSNTTSYIPDGDIFQKTENTSPTTILTQYSNYDKLYQTCTQEQIFNTLVKKIYIKQRKTKVKVRNNNLVLQLNNNLDASVWQNKSQAND